MFRASSAHLQEDTVIHMQRMVLSLCKHLFTEWQYHMLHVYNCILLKMSTWGSKHVEENIILWINNDQCIKLVINIYWQFIMHGQKNSKASIFTSTTIRTSDFATYSLTSASKVLALFLKRKPVWPTAMCLACRSSSARRDIQHPDANE